jgi:hypothetical protein
MVEAFERVAVTADWLACVTVIVTEPEASA